MTRPRHAPALLLALLTLAIAPPAARAGGDADSPWAPDSAPAAAHVAIVRGVVEDLERKVDLMRLSVARYATWEACLRGVPVSEYGDPDRQFGFAYAERDGSGRGFMPALGIDRRSPPGREDYLMLDFARGGGCRSEAPVPGGTADPARRRASAAGVSPSTLAGLERRVVHLRQEARRLDAASERFDEWSSCVSWVPVTEYGDPDGGFGYLFGLPPAPWSFRPALAVDRSDWDDPDYMLLAFVGGDRPGGTCQDEPGEGVD